MLNSLPKITGTYRKSAPIINWFGLPAIADVLFKPSSLADLQYFLSKVDNNISIQIIGAGSNVIMVNAITSGVIIKLGKEFSYINHHQNMLKVGGANLCTNVAIYCQKHSLGGLEFLNTIPGSIGGAIAMNAGCYGGEISQYLLEATALDYQGNLHKLTNQDFGFVYRGNTLGKKYIFIEAVFVCQPSNEQEISQKISIFQQQRQQSQPIRAKTGGSTFKNPPNHKAWQLIDAVGLRGYFVGDACFSDKHCNFLINTKQATAQNLLDLGKLAQEKIQQQFNISLQWELKLIK
jgi:UDP-N-acetylmuramate dehydrogenase